MMIFFVPGKPGSQGSKIAKCLNGKAVMLESSNDVIPWRNAVSAAALKQTPFDENDAVEVVLQFFLEKPKTVNCAVPSHKPDLDKLIRLTLDGLTASQIFGDDARVIGISASKSYATSDQESGCWIGVRRG